MLLWFQNETFNMKYSCQLLFICILNVLFHSILFSRRKPSTWNIVGSLCLCIYWMFYSMQFCSVEETSTAVAEIYRSQQFNKSNRTFDSIFEWIEFVLLDCCEEFQSCNLENVCVFSFWLIALKQKSNCLVSLGWPALEVFTIYI